MIKQSLLLASIALLASHTFGQTNAVIAKPIAERDLLAEALELALSVDDDWQQPKIIGEVASRYVLKGEPAKAMAALESIEPISRKAHAYFETAALCYEGDAEEADALMRRATERCEKIEDPVDRATLFTWIGSHGFKNERMEAANNALALASESAAKVEKDFERAKLEWKIAHQYARAGETNAFDSAQARALKTVRALPEQFLKNAALTAVAKNYAAMGRHAEYEVLLGVDNSDWNLIALELAETQQFKAAEKALKRITDPNNKAFATLITAHRLAEAGRWDEALALAASIEVPAKQADCYNGLAIKKAEANDFKHATELLAKAQVAANEATDFDALDYVFYSITQGLSRAQKPVEALELAQQIQSPQLLNHAFADIAIGYAEAGKFEQALALANTIEDPIMKARAYMETAAAQASSKPTDALKILELALVENTKTSYPVFKISMLVLAADVYDDLSLNPSKETL